MPEILFENSAWWLLLIVGLSAAAAMILYGKGTSFSRSVRLILATLRFFIFLLIGILLLSPLLKSTAINEEKPILVWLLDQSRSVMSSNDSSLLGELETTAEEQLSEKYELEIVPFAAGVAGDSLNIKATDISSALDYTRERFYNQNIAATVLATDGLYNQGANPVYLSSALPFPVFTLGLGDTTEVSDLRIERVVHNQVSYLGNRFPVEIYIKATDLEGEKAALTLSDKSGSTLYSERVEINSSDYFHRFDAQLAADEPGSKQFNVRLAPLEGEGNTRNNSESFTVEILESRKKVMIIGEAPHPDMAALYNALQNLERYQVESFIAGAIPENTADVDLFIFHRAKAGLIKKLRQPSQPLWWVGDANGQPQSLNSLLKIAFPSAGNEEVLPEYNPAFTAFTIPAELQEWSEQMPPLYSPFGDINSSGQVQTLLYKKIGAVETDQPLWFFKEEKTDNASARLAITLGSGLWRWRVEDYRANGNFNTFDQLVSQSVQYLTTQRQKQRFEVSIPNRLRLGNKLRGEARLYNPSMELVNDVQVSVNFINSEGEEYLQSFSSVNKIYQLNTGSLPAGSYNWRAFTQLGDERFERSGRLVVEDNDLEMQNTVARHDLLKKIGANTGGEFFTAAQFSELMNYLEKFEDARSIQRLESSTKSLVELRWLFFILMGLATLEWSLRKYYGNY